MQRRVRSPDAADDRGRLGQRLGVLQAGVDHGERLPVEAADAHLEPSVALVVGATTRATSSPLISAQSIPCSTTTSSPASTSNGRSSSAAGGGAICSPVSVPVRPDAASAPLDQPHLGPARSNRPARRARVAATVGVVGQHVQLVDRLLSGPRERGTQPPGAVRTDEDPSRSPAANVAPSGNPPGRPSTSAHRPRTSAAELGPEQGRPLVGLHRPGAGDYSFFDLRWP